MCVCFISCAHEYIYKINFCFVRVLRRNGTGEGWISYLMSLRRCSMQIISRVFAVSSPLLRPRLDSNGKLQL